MDNLDKGGDKFMRHDLDSPIGKSEEKTKEGAKALAEMLENTGGLSDEGAIAAKAIAEALSRRKQGMDNVLKYLKSGQQERGVTLIPFSRNVTLDGPRRDTTTGDIEDFKTLLEVIESTGGLWEGVRLDLSREIFGDELIKALAEILERTGGLKEGVRLFLRRNKLGNAGLKALVKMLERTGGLKEGVQLDLSNNNLGDEGVRALAEMLERTGGLKKGVELDLRRNNLSEETEQLLQQLNASGKGEIKF